MLTNHLNTRKIKFKKYKKESENHNVEFKTENLDYVKRLRAFWISWNLLVKEDKSCDNENKVELWSRSWLFYIRRS